MVQLFNTLVVGAALLGTVAYAQITAECGVGLGSCPSDKPCCSRMFNVSYIFDKKLIVLQNMVSAE